MNSETNPSQPKPASRRVLDAFDRRILGCLAADARQTYAAIGDQIGLSAPAVHDRVKRLRRDGVITRTVARLDGPSVGKPLLAFVHVDADGWGKSARMMTLRQYPEVEEIHSVAGDTSVVMKVRAAGTDDLEHFLAQLYALPGVRSTKSYIVLTSYLDRPVQADVTANWPALPVSPEETPG